MIVVACQAPAAAEDGKTLVDIRAEYIWRELYVRGPGFKAMAAAPNGAFGLALGMGTQEEASRGAWTVCTGSSTALSARPPSPQCTALAAGASWLAPAWTLDPDWQKPAKGADTPFRKGRKYPKRDARGIILFVHGCNGLGDKIFTDVWGAYFNALGFEFYAPNSFAVKRPKDVCGNVKDHPSEQLSAVWRLRIAQTQRTLADLKAANPGKPVFLFGHSEGGLIVQMINASVAGIIVSGEECGVFDAPVAAPAYVPILYLWGENDGEAVNGLGTPLSDASGQICVRRLPDRQMSFRVLKGRSHIPWPWNKEVNSAISTFVQVMYRSEVVSFPASKAFKATWKRTRVPKKYKTAKLNRAAAVGPGGRSMMVWGLDNVEDATQIALYSCSRARSDANVFLTGKYSCAVVDINGAPP